MTVLGEVPLTDVGLAMIKELHNALFRGTDASAAWLKWYLGLGNDVHGMPTRVYGAMDSSRLVAMWCVEPKRFHLPGQGNVPVGRCFGVGVHPDHRRRGLFLELSQYAIGRERALGDYQYVLGIPQVGKPVIEAHLKSGWEHVQDIEAMGLVPHRSEAAVSLHHVRAVQRLDDWALRYPGSFVEDYRYNDLRWSHHPNNHYIRLTDETSYLVAKPYRSACHVLDFNGSPTRVKVLLNAIGTLAYRHGWEEVTTWCATNDPHRADVEAVGFAPGARFASSVSLLAVRIANKEPLVLDQTHLQMGSDESY